MTLLRRLIFTSFLAATAAACVVAPGQNDEPEKTGTQEQGVLVAKPPPPDPLPFPPPNPVYCGTHFAPYCSVAPSKNPYWIETAARNGCSAPQYYTPPVVVGGIIGAVLSLCPDNAAIRSLGYSVMAPQPCDRCLPRAPAGQIYLSWVQLIGPGCQGGCLGTGGTGP